MTRSPRGRKLNPGSKEALDAGCLCPVIDNHYGKGAHGMPGMYWIRENCPLHGSEAPRRKAKARKARRS